MTKCKPSGFFVVLCVISAAFLSVLSVTSPAPVTASPTAASFDPSQPQFNPLSPSFDPFAIVEPCARLEPYTVEAAYRESILAGQYETLDKIELSGNEVLEINNKRVVLNGDLILSDSARLVIENSYILWNNSYMVQYIGKVKDSAVLEVRHSVIVKGSWTNMNLWCEAESTLIMSKSVSFVDIIYGNVVTVDSSNLAGIVGIQWKGDQPADLRITNSRARQITMDFSKGEPENVRLSGLRWGGPQWVSIRTTEGASLELENVWIGGENKDSFRFKGGWILVVEEEPYVEGGWEPGTIVPENAVIGAYPNRKHYILEDSEIDSMWLWFKENSRVKMANWKTGHIGYWNLRENFEVQGVNYDITLENTFLTYVKWLIRGEAEIENNENIQLSPYGRNVSVLATNSKITWNINLRGKENVKLVNCSVPSGIMFRDGRGLYLTGWDIHHLEFENTTISGNMDISSTYTRVSGTVTILIPEANVDYDWGIVEREYPVEVRDENGAPVGNVPVGLFDPENNLVWSGTAGQDGSTNFVISFTENNWNRKWRLDTAVNGKGISGEVGFLTSTPILLSTMIDTDGDEMSDAWENQYGLNPNNPGDASQDKDGDGYPNLQEYQAGTDPSLASSHPGAPSENIPGGEGAPPAEGTPILYVAGVVAIGVIVVGILLFLKKR